MVASIGCGIGITDSHNSKPLGKWSTSVIGKLWHENPKSSHHLIFKIKFYWNTVMANCLYYLWLLLH